MSERNGSFMKKQSFFDVQEFNNIKEIIYNSVNKYENKTAFIIKKPDKEKIYKSYKEFLEDINSLGTAFFEMGLKGKRIAIIGKNRYEWILTHLSNVLGNIISIPIDKDLQIQELESSLIRSKADAIVFDDKILPLIEEIKAKNSTYIKKYISMDKTSEYLNIPDLVQEGKKLILEGNNEYIETKIIEDKMSILLFTSGTTAKSKAVMLSHKNIASNIYAMQSVEDIRDTDTNIAFLPFHHIFGGTCIIMMLASGVTNVFPDGLRYIKQNMKEYKVSIFVGVPILTEAIYKAIIKEIEKQGKLNLIKKATRISNAFLKIHIDLRRKIFKSVIDALGGNLRLIISGGAPADELSIKGFRELGIDTVQGYGLSETSPVIAAESFFSKKLGSVGFPMRNDTIEIVNKDESGIGEIRVKGPNVMLGYYEMPEDTKKSIIDGWFYTGDLGYFDEEGFLYITGRNKNLIVLKNGKKIFPEELETLINRIDLVNECIVFGWENKEDKNDITLAVKIVYDEEVIKEKYNDKSEEDLEKIVWENIKKVNTTFPRYKHIQKLITSHTELIKTTTKKVKRNEEIKNILKDNK